jgi:hypothetical protein
MRPVIVIGDIHGRADLFRALLAEIRDRYGNEVDLYHIGDIIDRGPDSKEVVQLCIDNEVDGILGNHELWLHQWCATGVFDPFCLHPSMQGKASLKSYGLHYGEDQVDRIQQGLANAIPQSHRDYILSLPVSRKIEAGGKVYRLIHSGLKRETAESWWEDARDYQAHASGQDNIEDALMDVIVSESPASILWTSNSWKNGPDLYHFKDGSIQILGHSPVPRGEPIINAHWMAIDCGCGVRRSVLAGVVLGSHEVIKVDGLSVKGVGKADGFSDFTM